MVVVCLHNLQCTFVEKPPQMKVVPVFSSFAVHIQANLEDDLVKEALKTGVDLRQYSKQVESELQRIEQASIKDCILPQTHGLVGDILMYRREDVEVFHRWSSCWCFS